MLGLMAKTESYERLKRTEQQQVQLNIFEIEEELFHLHDKIKGLFPTNCNNSSNNYRHNMNDSNMMSNPSRNPPIALMHRSAVRATFTTL